eukprot:m.284843 g.284843  ORF g.284843 m.284843 type:complete len:352 (+) comp19914_c0_seq5:379-1434(+)
MNYIAIRPGLRAHKYVYTFVICLSILSQRLFVAGQPLRSPQTEPACIRTCIAKNIDCQSCVKELAERLSTPKHMDLPYYKAHDGVPDPVVGVRHHHFLDRPPWVPGSSNTHHQPGDGKTIAEGKVHTNCPAMRARSRAPGITLRMPYTVRFHRAGVIEVDCHWISEAYVHSLTVGHPVDSPWIRLPQSHMQIFTVGDSRADVWIVNSGIYINDESFMSSPNADPADKGGYACHGGMPSVLPRSGSIVLTCARGSSGGSEQTGSGRALGGSPFTGMSVLCCAVGMVVGVGRRATNGWCSLFHTSYPLPRGTLSRGYFHHFCERVGMPTFRFSSISLHSTTMLISSKLPRELP